ncbi:MAG: hypothetical protein AAGH53_08405 [Pseudomonadota bacterium]
MWRLGIEPSFLQHGQANGGNLDSDTVCLQSLGLTIQLCYFSLMRIGGKNSKSWKHLLLIGAAIVTTPFSLSNAVLYAQSTAYEVGSAAPPCETQNCKDAQALKEAGEIYTEATRKAAPHYVKPVVRANPIQPASHFQELLNHNQQALSAFNASGVIEECNRYAARYQNITGKPLDDGTTCKRFRDKRARFEEAIAKAREYGAIASNNEADLAASKDRADQLDEEHEKVMAGLKSESAANADFLARENASLERRLASQSNKSLGDFLADLGPSAKSSDASTQVGSGDFLSDLGPKGSSSGKGDAGTNDDFLAQTGTKGDFLSEATDVGGHKIVKTDGLEGVVDALGRTLIPMRKWRVLDYQSGIAEVSIEFNNLACNGAGYATTIAYRQGFIGKDGEFIDTPKITFYDVPQYDEPYVGLTLRRYNNDQSYAEQDRRYQRAMARKRREQKERERIAKQRCERETIAWKNRLLSRN